MANTEIIQGSNGRWYFTIHSRDTRVVRDGTSEAARSTQSYASRTDAQIAADALTVEINSG